MDSPMLVEGGVRGESPPQRFAWPVLRAGPSVPVRTFPHRVTVCARMRTGVRRGTLEEMLGISTASCDREVRGEERRVGRPADAVADRLANTLSSISALPLPRRLQSPVPREGGRVGRVDGDEMCVARRKRESGSSQVRAAESPQHGSLDATAAWPGRVQQCDQSQPGASAAPPVRKSASERSKVPLSDRSAKAPRSMPVTASRACSTPRRDQRPSRWLDLGQGAVVWSARSPRVLGFP